MSSCAASAPTPAPSCRSKPRRHRFQAILTDQDEADIAAIERRHRARARVEDQVRSDKDTGLENLPFRDFALNAVWLELVLIAHDLIGWPKALALTGELARSERAVYGPERAWRLPERRAGCG